MTNVVLITVDCLRADHLGCMGYHRDTSPFLDNLSHKSMFFSHAFANGPNTRHSVPSFLSSTYPLLFLDEAKGGKFHHGRLSVAEVFKKNGFVTAGIHSNPYVSQFYGYDRGFDYFNDFLLGQVDRDVKRGSLSNKFYEGLKGVKALVFHQLPHETGEEINESVFNWLDSVDSSFFLWVHYMDVHMPYVPPNDFLRKLDLRSYSYARKVWMGKKIDDLKMRENIKDKEISDYVNLYDGTIRYTDQVIANLVKGIEHKFSDTVFVITADHGEEFREHGGLSHVEKLYDELLHVPLMMYGKDVESKQVSDVVSLVDLAPMILDIAGVDIPQDFMGGVNFSGKDFIIGECFNDGLKTAYRDLEWKYISGSNDNKLFYIAEDELETKDVSVEHKDLVNKFESVIQSHKAGLLAERKKRLTRMQKEKVKNVIGKIKL